MSLSNLPPGVSVSDIPGNRPEDELAEAIAEGWRPRCEVCGGFLPIEPTGFDFWEDAVECSGKPKRYDHEYEEGTIAILGEEYRGKTYAVYLAECGLETGPQGHPAHREILGAGTIEIRKCKLCGTENREAT